EKRDRIGALTHLPLARGPLLSATIMGALSSGPPYDGGRPSQYVAGFELIGELGRGGYTVTYRVRLHTSVYALTVLQRRGGEELTIRAFRREAALLASVNHPGLVRVHEVGVANEQPYLVMDFVDGRPLSGLIGDGPLPLDQAVRIGADVASALGA